MNDRTDARTEKPLSERFFDTILAFPGRLDAMETRDEQACRKLAFQLAELAEREFARRGKA